MQAESLECVMARPVILDVNHCASGVVLNDSAGRGLMRRTSLRIVFDTSGSQGDHSGGHRISPPIRTLNAAVVSGCSPAQSSARVVVAPAASTRSGDAANKESDSWTCWVSCGDLPLREAARISSMFEVVDC